MRFEVCADDLAQHPSTPAALAGIAVGAEPSTRTVVAAGHHPGVLSVLVSTTHDPAGTAVGVTRNLAGAAADARLSVGRLPAPTAVDRDQPGMSTQIITRG